MVKALSQLLEHNSFDKDEMENILYLCLMNSVFEELVKHIENNNIEFSVKKRLQNAFNIKEEIYIVSELLKEFSDLKLTSDHSVYLLTNLKAYFSKSNNRLQLPLKLKEALLADQSMKCNYCSTKITINDAHFDHLMAFKWVGDEVDNNYQALCSDCNLEKGTNVYFALKSFLLKRTRSANL